MVESLSFEKLLLPDRSAWDRLWRHGLYWLVMIVVLAFSLVYWSQSASAALTGAFFSSLFRYMPSTYLFLYFVLPVIMQGKYRAAAARLVIWLALCFFWRFVLQITLPSNLLFYCALPDLAETTIEEHALRHLFCCTIPNLSKTAVDEQQLRELFGPSFIVTNSIVVMAASLNVFRHHYQHEQANQQLARETLSIELQLLKAQVQPHFLFNTLNNIYSLTLLESERAGEIVRKLSALLSYMFGDCDRPEVALSKEIELLKNYTELEQLRYGRRLKVVLNIHGELTGIKIAPLLLIPFVENAFKHGASEQTDQAEIAIHVYVNDNQLAFRIENSKAAIASNAQINQGGLGLQNVRKRLNLLYPGRHTLSTHAEASRFIVDLTIQLPPAYRITGSRTMDMPTSAEYHPQMA
jgi:sensor histidine kinase YesM